MDLPDNILEELEYLDNITSCNKVENCLMLSEYEQNLIKEKEWPQSVTAAYRRARKWSLVRQSSSVIQGGHFLTFYRQARVLVPIPTCLWVSFSSISLSHSLSINYSKSHFQRSKRMVLISTVFNSLESLLIDFVKSTN